MLLASLYLVGFVVSGVVEAQKACYSNDQQVDNGLSPCSPSAAESACCRPGLDLCLSNGLCQSTGLNIVAFRGCTDKTFNSTACFQQCHAVRPAGAVKLTPCGQDYVFCCGQDSDARACCDRRNGSFQVNGPGNLVFSSPNFPPSLALLNFTGSFTGSIITTTVVSTAQPTATGSSSGSSTGTVKESVPIGIGVGLGLGMVIAAIGAGLLGYTQGKKRARRDTGYANGLASMSAGHNNGMFVVAPAPVQTQPSHELGGG